MSPQTNLRNLKDTTQYGGFHESNIVSSNFTSTPNYKFSFSAKIHNTGIFNNVKVFYFVGNDYNDFTMHMTSNNTVNLYAEKVVTTWSLPFNLDFNTTYYLKLSMDAENSNVTLGIRSDPNTALYDNTKSLTLSANELIGDWIIGTHKYATNENWRGNIENITISDSLLPWDTAFPIG